MATSSPSIRNLEGNWSMSRTLSSDFTPILAMQGVNYVLRRVAAIAPMHWTVKQPSENELVIDQTTLASFPASKEEWVHDWQAREYTMGSIGTVSRRSRWAKTSEVLGEEPFLTEGLAPDTEVIEEEMNSVNNSWKARYVWRFDGPNLVRRLVIQKGNDKIEALLVYEPKK